MTHSLLLGPSKCAVELTVLSDNVLLDTGRCLIVHYQATQEVWYYKAEGCLPLNSMDAISTPVVFGRLVFERISVI